jgi:hypothetical protein
MSLDIIEVLTNAPGQAGTFTIDTTQQDVAVTSLPAGHSLNMVNGAGNKTFPQGDNFNLLSIGVSLPYSFVASVAMSGANQYSPVIQFNYTKTGGGGGVLPGLAGGLTILPFLNYELAIGQYIDVAGILDSFYLKGFFNAAGVPHVSMIGVPTTMNGQTFEIQIWMKIEHNLPLTA